MASLLTILRELSNDPCWGKKTPSWLPDRHMKSLKGKVAVLTGPTAGIGLETARQLVLSNTKVYFFGRNVAKMESVRDTLRTECEAALAALKPDDKRFGGAVGEMVLVQCDLSDLDSVKRAADDFLAREQRLDLLFGNAGLVLEGKTQQGYELMLGTNTLAHHALVRLLLPALRRAAADGAPGETRVVLTASGAHRFVDQPIHMSPEGLDDYRKGKLSNSTHLYGRSKMGNIYTAQKLAALSAASGDGIISCAVHPGAIQSDIGASGALITRIKKWILYPATLGAVTQLWGAVGADAQEVNGRYLVPYARVGELNALGEDAEARDKVWKWCEEQCLMHGLIAEIIA
ncbi:short-chain alcohol dehydrogenase [Thecaphora frezii]